MFVHYGVADMDQDMEDSQDMATQESVDVAMGEADSCSCNGDHCGGCDDDEENDDQGWPIDDVEMTIGDEYGDGKLGACHIQSGDERPARYGRGKGKTNWPPFCRWRQDLACSAIGATAESGVASH